MSELVTPIASPEIAGVPVRFFRSPEPGPHLPWHALDDLCRAMGYDSEMRTRTLRHAQAYAEGEFRTVATPDGPVVIGSHVMAQSVILAAVEVHGLAPAFELLYVRSGLSVAMDALTGDLPAGAAYDVTLAAARNTLGLKS